MAQVKIFALRHSLENARAAISQAIHSSVMEALEYPPEKKFHRFMALDEEDFNPNHVNITDEQYRKLCDR